MPSYVVQHVQMALNDDKKPLNGSKILLLGIAYKANIGDTRESPAFVIWKLLEESKASVSYYDPLVPKIKGHLSSQFQFLKGRTGIPDDELPGELATSDCVVVITPHSFFKQQDAVGGRQCIIQPALQTYNGPVVDTRNWVPASWGLKVYKA
uniref:UDP-glucose/GDP-mannose dehydrogenase C-terminal domain-containing protein n=3 Tax=Guillardia theta TaxID=55529 RepID=A0A7S4UR74_GUITH|mmetsp:Transcript_43707/g.138172  ORF Transcript_43707/g.138172 Transcript_43707/m.138172 type:complete len:152 (+) Transcript_43707:115-570(+)